MSASRGVERTPLPARSTTRAPSTPCHVAAAAVAMRANVESTYPTTIQGRLRPPTRSESQPEKNLTTVEIASGIPSTSPTAITGAPRVRVRNSGRIG
jgi:hypothetical protein